jgi:hypothetical protein
VVTAPVPQEPVNALDVKNDPEKIEKNKTKQNKAKLKITK